jgi:lariat debranching enzyme
VTTWTGVHPESAARRLFVLFQTSNRNIIIRMKIAVVGCLHGELDKVYRDIQQAEQQQGCQVDLVLVCGDFQSVRNQHDLKCMAVPPKYAQLGDFHDYFYGRKKAPILTLFVGGNHEASNYISSLAYGGWVCDNIYYMGYSGVVRFGGLRIAGVSGIYKSHDSFLGHYEKLPYDGNSLRSVFHIRRQEIHRILTISNRHQEQPIDIFLSHDWPLNIHANATPQDQMQLRRQKKHFCQEMDDQQLGDILFQPVLNHLKPRHWFAAHLHVKFKAAIEWTDTATSQFLALDKCLPGRKYLEVMDIDPKEPGDKVLSYDPEWMTILRKTDRLLSIDRQPNNKIPNVLDMHAIIDPVTDEDVQETTKMWGDDFTIPRNFSLSEPALADRDTDPQRTRSFTNPQTTAFCEKIKIMDPIAKLIGPVVQLQNPDEIDLNEDEDESEAAAGDEPNKRIKTDADLKLESGSLFVIDKIGARK